MSARLRHQYIPGPFLIQIDLYFRIGLRSDFLKFYVDHDGGKLDRHDIDDPKQTCMQSCFLSYIRHRVTRSTWGPAI